MASTQRVSITPADVEKIKTVCISTDLSSPSSIRSVLFKPLSDRVILAVYLGEEVLILRENGYVNGPMIASLGRTKGGNPKQFKNWLDSPQARELMYEVTSSLPDGKHYPDGTHDPPPPLTVVRTDLPMGQRGTYIHPDLVPCLGAWASPKLGVKMARIVNAFEAEKAVEAYRREIAKSSVSIREAIADRDRAIGEAGRLTKENLKIMEEIREVKERSIALQRACRELIGPVPETRDALETFGLLSSDAPGESNDSVPQGSSDSKLSVASGPPADASPEKGSMAFYILTTPSNRERSTYKIGITRRDAGRLYKRYTTAIPDMELILYQSRDDAARLESHLKKTHLEDRLKGHSGERSEWVRIDLKRLMKEVEEFS